MTAASLRVRSLPIFLTPLTIFIGTVSLETRKQIGPRTSLSLWTDYEYISSVPKMHYADDNRSTRIDDEGIFASRTMLRLNIGLGSQQLYMSR
jgi:hypothetical protein